MGIVRPIRHNFHIKVPSHRVRPAQRLRNGWPKTWVGGGLGGGEGRWGGGGGGGRAPTTGRSGPENVRSPSRAPWADERRRIWCGWATDSPQPDVVGASSTSSQQPAAAASSTGLRDTREGGERGARGGSSAGGQPEGGPCPSGRPHDFPAATAWARWCWLLPGGALLLLPGPWEVALGRRRALVWPRRARSG